MQRPWNIVKLPVYSLVTKDMNGDFNMNICTYVACVSMKPKIYAVVVYKNTKSLENLIKYDDCVLQLLNQNHFNLVKTLGFKSGYNYNKIKYLEKKDLIENWEDFKTLKNCSALLKFSVNDIIETGDHHLAILKNIKYLSRNDNYLTTQILGEKGIIRI